MTAENGDIMTIEHAGDPEYYPVTRWNAGQMLNLANMQSGCHAASRTWSN